MAYTLIANTGIHITTFPLEISPNNNFRVWFHEWNDGNHWMLDQLQEIDIDTNRFFFEKRALAQNGFLEAIEKGTEIDTSLLADKGIKPLDYDEDNDDIYSMTFSDRNNTLSSFENKWLPIPYFFKRGNRYRFEPLNWSRFKLVPTESSGGKRNYIVLLAFDTRTTETQDNYKECPTFPDQFLNTMEFGICPDELLLMDYCSPQPNWEYINNYLFSLVHPGMESVDNLLVNRKRLSYIASYFHLIDYIAKNNLFPIVTLQKDKDVQIKDVDMVVDIGNSRTTALLVENNSDFNQVNQLELIDYTNLVKETQKGPMIASYKEPFDMRLAFRKVDFGDIGMHGSKQFVYPSFVRLGKEANNLIHKASARDEELERLTTMSSPKRYLWDSRSNKEEWNFMIFDGEKDNHVLYIPGISEYLKNDGRIDERGNGGKSYHYSKRSLMTFAFLEMLVQAQTQINSHQYRTDRGDMQMPRRIKRVIVTCPTAMSKIEREALVKCAEDAVKLLSYFNNSNNRTIIVPSIPSFRDEDKNVWYYDEATCSQLVYIYGEVGYKYKGACEEFFNIYGHNVSDESQPELTIGSLDIGAGTTDLMISKYTYKRGDVTTIIPEPLFYDSFYYAGDDMLNELIKQVMFFSSTSAFRRNLKGLSEVSYRQKLRDFFGPDHTGQTIADRQLRRDFNLQYSIPLMYHMLELLSHQSKDCKVRFTDVFDDCPPNERVLKGFERFFGFGLKDIEWEYVGNDISNAVSNAFEPLLKKIATIMHSYGCDIVLLTGRPSSLSPIRNIFLKYYTVSPNRLILLNNYYVGHWYPFGDNTGYITNPKTIVAMGALIGYYATTLSNLDRFTIDKSKLDEIKSVINYIEATHERQPIEYLITPEKNSGELMVSSLPTKLNVRQLGIDTYPARRLYTIDFNENSIGNGIRKKLMLEGRRVNDTAINAMVIERLEALRARMPFYLKVDRDPDDKEKLIIESIRDKKNEEIPERNLEINIQSLGTDDGYWLDSGAFEIL